MQSSDEVRMKPSLSVKDISVRVAAFPLDDLSDTIFAGHHQPLRV